MLEELKIAVENKDIEEAKNIMTKMVYKDKCTPVEFKEALDLGSKYNIFEEYNDNQFLLNPKECKEINLNKLKEHLKKNFSKELLAKIYYLRKYMDTITEKNQVTVNLGSDENYKDFSTYTKLCAIASVVTAGVLVAGAWKLFRRNKNK